MTSPIFTQLVDIEQIRRLLEAHYKTTGVLSAILDTEENILVAVGWQDICTRFHRINPESRARCLQSDARIKTQHDELRDGYLEYRCGNGMREAAMPIVIEGEHLATFFAGQFFYDDERPDPDYFRNQAREFGFDEESYLEALSRVPVRTRAQIGDIMEYNGLLVRMMVETGLKNLNLTREVEERKKAEKEASFFRTLIEYTRDPVYVLDPEDGWRLVYVNQAACAHFGMDRERMLTMRIPDWDPAFDMGAIGTLWQQLQQGNPLHFETIHRVASGELVPVEVTANYLEHDGKKLSAGYFRDISARKTMEASLRKTDLLLVQQSRQAAMGEMINYIAHQWRQPLNVIGLLVQAMRADYVDGESSHEGVEHSVEQILNLIRHMSSTIDDFRDFFKADKEPKPFNLKDTASRAVSFISDTLTLNSIKLTIEAEDDLIVTGYPNEFSHVLLNILNNAREALTDRHIPSPRIIIRIHHEGERNVITIRDNAGGISPEIIGRLFEPYVTTKESGTGIGLYMSKTIIEKRMQGSIVAYNVGDGAEFRIEL
ncbi:PAS domain S-box protein [bacterium]|nr:PAS domain S-box protein [bacterium]